jgi:hypothetical protein
MSEGGERGGRVVDRAGRRRKEEEEKGGRAGNIYTPALRYRVKMRTGTYRSFRQSGYNNVL